MRSILQDHEGSFWFGTQNHGLVRLRDHHLTAFTERDGLGNNSVWSLHEDAAGTLWLGTENGVTRYRDGKFFAFTTQHGLQENIVNCILEDDFGFFWLSGLRGIYRIKRGQLDDIACGRATQAECAIVDTADGMESSETNGERQPAGWKARDGRLWFPTTQGVVMIDPRTYPIGEIPPQVVLEQVIADDRVIAGGLIGADGRRRHSDIRKPDSKASVSRATPVRLAPGRAGTAVAHEQQRGHDTPTDSRAPRKRSAS